VKEFWKSVKNGQSYRHEFGGPVFFLEHSVYCFMAIIQTTCISRHPELSTGWFCWSKVWHGLPDNNQCIQITEKMLGFSSTMLPAPSPSPCTSNSLNLAFLKSACIVRAELVEHKHKHYSPYIRQALTVQQSAAAELCRWQSCKLPPHSPDPQVGEDADDKPVEWPLHKTWSSPQRNPHSCSAATCHNTAHSNW